MVSWNLEYMHAGMMKSYSRFKVAALLGWMVGSLGAHATTILTTITTTTGTASPTRTTSSTTIPGSLGDAASKITQSLTLPPKPTCTKDIKVLHVSKYY